MTSRSEFDDMTLAPGSSLYISSIEIEVSEKRKTPT